MFANPAVASMFVFLAVSVLVCSAGFVIFLKAYGDRRQALSRLRDLAVERVQPLAEQTASRQVHPVAATLSRIGALTLPGRKECNNDLKNQLLHAGYPGAAAVRVFLGVKALFVVGLVLLWIIFCYTSGRVPGRLIALYAVGAGAVGMLVPNVWLKGQVRKRQGILRRALPDALDLLVLCLESSVSLVAAIQRVTDELLAVHPLLGAEMNMTQREINMGLSPGEALKNFGQRSGLLEVRELASIILQSERSGAGIAKALRTHADCARLQRNERAKELAQKMAVKILFPTLLCIFPAIFVVLLAPAAFQIASMFTR